MFPQVKDQLWQALNDSSENAASMCLCQGKLFQKDDFSMEEQCLENQDSCSGVNPRLFLGWTMHREPRLCSIPRPQACACKLCKPRPPIPWVTNLACLSHSLPPSPGEAHTQSQKCWEQGLVNTFQYLKVRNLETLEFNKVSVFFRNLRNGQLYTFFVVR